MRIHVRYISFSPRLRSYTEQTSAPSNDHNILKSINQYRQGFYSYIVLRIIFQRLLRVKSASQCNETLVIDITIYRPLNKLQPPQVHLCI